MTNKKQRQRASSVSSLARLNKARQELALLTRIDSIKEIRDKAEALRAYCKQAGESLEAQNDCAEIKIRAERRAGELLRENGRKRGETDKTIICHDRRLSPTLKELGIEPKQSMRWQIIAAIPETVFEQHIEVTRSEASELTTAGLLKLAKNARDPLLRMTAPRVLSARVGDIVTSAELEESVEASAPSRFSATTRKRIAQNSLASWTQSGHLSGRRVKKRRHPVVTAANTAYALLLGYLSGSRGPMLFNTFWTGLLDAPTEDLHTMTAEASRREWLDYRRLGTVVEVSFNGLLTQREKEALNG